MGFERFYLKRARPKFSEICTLLSRLGFAERVKGSHHIFTRDGVTEILNLQPRKSLAKPYQVKQVRRVLLQFAADGSTRQEALANAETVIAEMTGNGSGTRTPRS
jgi:predicted RNA binding protein YcfA (HicA-like mRNA interferase family)